MALALALIPRAGGANPTAADAAPATAPAAGAPREEQARFAASAMASLQVPDTGADVLPLIAEALRTQDGDPAKFGESVNKLVAGLLAGPHPSVLVDAILPTVEVGTRATGTQNPPPPGWKYGTYSQRADLVKSLWGLAEKMREKDPKRAGDFARASLVLAALNDYEVGWAQLGHVLTDAEATKKLLALPVDHFDALQRLVTDRQSKQKAWATESLAGGEAIDAMNTASPPTFPAPDVQAALAHFDKAFRSGPAQGGTRWLVIVDTWDFLNIARSQGKADVQAAIEKQLRTWKHGYPDPNIGRWVDEALARTGAAPTQMVGEFVMKPDGTIVPKEKAGGK